MTIIVNLARHLAAVCQPVTGDRADGVVTVTASGADVTLDRNTYAIPVVENEYRDDLACKVGEGPNEDKSWTVTSGGTDVDFVSNLGGVRQNLAQGVKLYFDPAVAGIASAVVKTDFSNGADPTALGLRDFVIYERFRAPDEGLDLKRAFIGGLPAALLAWIGSEPADGATVSQVVRGTRTGRQRVLYKENFELLVFTERMESDYRRMDEGLRILDALTYLLTDRRAADGSPLSAPSGVQVRQRFRRDFIDHNGFQAYNTYGMALSAMQTYQMDEYRSFNDLALIVVDMIKPQIPPLPQQGDYPLVGAGLPGTPGMEIDM